MRFLYALRRLGSPSAAARAITLPLSTAYSARSRDPVFRQQWQAALASHQQLRHQISRGPTDKSSQ